MGSGLASIPQIAQIPGLQAALDARALLAGAAFTGAVTLDNGTLTASAPVLNVAQRWNNAAVDFHAADTNVTNDASGAGSTLQRWRVGSTAKAWITKGGAGVFSNFLYLDGVGSAAYLIYVGGAITSDRRLATPGIDASEYFDIAEMAAPAAPAANTARLYVEDSGGKSRLMAVFPSGAAQQIAIEP